MTKTDVQLRYQQVVGGSLDAIKHITENNNRPLQNYIDWLEEQIPNTKTTKS